jgi:hypothetical protein
VGGVAGGLGRGNLPLATIVAEHGLSNHRSCKGMETPLAGRSQIKHSYASHHQQPQNDSRSDELDPFLIVREPAFSAAP